MNPARTKRLSRSAAVAVPLAAALVLTGCSSDDDATASGEVTYPTVPVVAPGEGISLGHDDQEIGDTIPETVHVGGKSSPSSRRT